MDDKSFADPSRQVVTAHDSIPSSTYVSPAKREIEEIQAVLGRDEYLQDPRFAPYRNLMQAAHNSANGGGANIRDLSTTVVLMANAMTLKELREPSRIKAEVAEAIVQFHTTCPGKELEPVVKLLSEHLAKTIGATQTPLVAPAAVVSEEANQFMTPFGTIKGPVVKMAVKYLFLGLMLMGTFYLLLLRQDERLRKHFAEQVMPVAVEIARNRLITAPSAQTTTAETAALETR